MLGYIYIIVLDIERALLQRDTDHSENTHAKITMLKYVLYVVFGECKKNNMFFHVDVLSISCTYILQYRCHRKFNIIAIIQLVTPGSKSPEGPTLPCPKWQISEAFAFFVSESLVFHGDFLFHSLIKTNIFGMRIQNI